MKLIIALLFALGPALSFAVGFAPTKFTCGGMGPGTVFGVDFGGPRFADNVFINYLAGDLKPMLLVGEENLQTSNETLSMNLQVGACQKVENSDVLVTCSLKPRAWMQAHYGFTKSEELAPGFFQGSRITRDIDVKKFDLKVVRAGTDANLSLSMTVDTADKKNLVVTINKKLATLNQDWYMCKFE